MTIVAAILFLLGVITIFAHHGHSQTPTPPCVGKYPLEPSVIGRGDAQGGCSPGGNEFDVLLDIHSWGLYFRPYFWYGNGCPEEIIIPYTKVNRPAVLYHRPHAKPSSFAKSHPNLLKKHRSGHFVKFPCRGRPVRKVHVWKNRAQFVSLLTKTVRGVEYIRDLDCMAPEYYGNPSTRYNWTEVQEKIAQDRVPTAALTFLHNLAYSNFFCVKN